MAFAISVLKRLRLKIHVHVLDEINTNSRIFLNPVSNVKINYVLFDMNMFYIVTDTCNFKEIYNTCYLTI